MAYNKRTPLNPSRANERAFDLLSDTVKTGVKGVSQVGKNIVAYDQTIKPLVKGFQRGAASHQRSLKNLNDKREITNSLKQAGNRLDDFKNKSEPVIESPGTVTSTPVQKVNQNNVLQGLPNDDTVNYNDSNIPGGSVRITSGPNKGMLFTARGSGGRVKSYDADGNLMDNGEVRKLMRLEEGQNQPARGLRNFGSDNSYRVNNSGLDVQFDESTPQEERQAFMRAPTRPGTRMRSNLPGKETPLTGQDGSQKRRLMEIVETSTFPRQRQTALKALELLEQSEQFDAAAAENVRQFDTTTAENTKQFDQQEDRITGQNIIKNQQENTQLNINQQKADTDAEYKNYLVNKPDERNTLSKNQYMNQDQNFRKAWEKRTAVGSLTAGPNDYIDPEGTKPLDHKIALYRDDITTAMDMYGPPNAQQKAILDINANPEVWLRYVSMSPEQQQQFLSNHIQNKGY